MNSVIFEEHSYFNHIMFYLHLKNYLCNYLLQLQTMPGCIF